ncbi:hypothetical protein LTR84_000146 [Exophiala bonariae]|uniref:AB hydrolase-1 domain-containing protein n=1 Tax=Exophiala bonariae TaxID=1690606 RepID=A0AAV9NTG9_9EURO|nr:hypothetical protein LTR84_000146 [Exophiala bonariae]
MEKPTVVLIPGSFCSAALLWDAVIDDLHDAGYEATAIELRTVSPPSTSPPRTMTDDAAHIHGVIEALANEGREILIVMSSYGGIPGTQATQDMTLSQRQSDGKTGGVMGLVYVSALLINEGESSEDSFAPFVTPQASHSFFKVSGEYLHLDPVGSAAVIFSGLPKPVGESLTRKMPGHAAGSFREPMTSTSHYDIPVTYIKCTDDRIVLPDHQQKMIDDFKLVSHSTVKVIEVDCGHCPMVERPKETTQAIIQAARSNA